MLLLWLLLQNKKNREPMTPPENLLSFYLSLSLFTALSLVYAHSAALVSKQTAPGRGRSGRVQIIIITIEFASGRNNSTSITEPFTPPFTTNSSNTQQICPRHRSQFRFVDTRLIFHCFAFGLCARLFRMFFLVTSFGKE